MGKCMFLRKGETHTAPSLFSTILITADNIEDYFTVTNGNYYFAGSGNVFTSNNSGVDSSTASTILTAKQNYFTIIFDYSYSSEANYDKFTLKVNDTTVENGVSGATTNKSYSGSLTTGKTVEFTYTKDGSQHKNDDKCTFSNMYVTILKAGILASYLSVGSTVKLMENNTAVEYLVVNQGIPSNSSLYDSSCNGTWLLRKDAHSQRVWDISRVNIYETSVINTWLNGDFFNSLGTVEQATIKQVKIPYRKNGGSGGTDQTGSNGLSCKIFLLSGYEVGQTSSNNKYFPVDGAKLSYFESGNGTSAKNKRVANYNGSAASWWLRSPYTNDTDHVWYVYSSGICNNYYPSEPCGIRPALILPSNALFDKNTLILKGVV